MARRKPSSAAFWATVVVGALVAYPLSFGPACWIASRIDINLEVIPGIYLPITWGLSHFHHGPLDKTISWYSKLFAADDFRWWPYTERDDDTAEFFLDRHSGNSGRDGIGPGLSPLALRRVRSARCSGYA